VEARCRPGEMERRRVRLVERDDGESVAEVEIALHDRADGIAECAADWQDRDSWFVATRIINAADGDATKGRVLRPGQAGRRATAQRGGDCRRANQTRQRRAEGSNRKRTGRMSSRKPGGSAPNALAFAAASTA